MTDDRDVLDAVRSALHSEPRVHATDGPIRLAFADGELTMEGEVDHIAGKKLALEAAARVPGVSIIIDRLHVRPATPMGDGEIRDQVRDALLRGDHARVLHHPRLGQGAVGDGAGTGGCHRNDRRPGRGRRRDAGWRRDRAWTEAAGRRARLVGAGQPRRDQRHRRHAAGAGQRGRGHRCRAAGAGKAIRSSTAESIRVHTRRAVVTLDGTVPRDAERKLAEDDAWYVFGVDKVINRLDVRA